MHVRLTYLSRLLLCLLLVWNSSNIHAQQIPDSLFPVQPSPQRLVNDFTGTLSNAENKWLEDKLVAFDVQTSSQVSIVIVKTIGDYAVADYATALGRRWGIGRQGKNNGVLILMVMQSRDVHIATGYGLEGALPDALCKQIIENEMVPMFKRGYYYDGLDKATTVIMSAAKGEYTAQGPYGSQSKGMPRWLIILLLIVGINGFFLFVIPGLIRLFYYLIGKKPPVRRPSSWTYTSNETTGSNDTSGSSSSSGSVDFGGYGGGSFGGGGASGKW